MSDSQAGLGRPPVTRTGETLEAILREYRGRRGVLLEILHRVQEAYGYVPAEAMDPIAKTLRMHAPTVYGTLTFYTEFRTSPPPPVLIEQCLGPTCYLLNAAALKEILCYRLGMDDAGRHPENRFGWHEIECAGHCHLAPLLYMNGEVHARVGPDEAVALADRAKELASGSGPHEPRPEEEAGPGQGAALRENGSHPARASGGADGSL